MTATCAFCGWRFDPATGDRGEPCFWVRRPGHNELVEGNGPLCGDCATIYLQLPTDGEDDGRIYDDRMTMPAVLVAHLARQEVR